MSLAIFQRTAEARALVSRMAEWDRIEIADHHA
jgi:hypothetical protein